MQRRAFPSTLFLHQRSSTMLRHSIAGLLALLILVGAAYAADKKVKATVVKVDVKKKMITVKTDEGEKHYTVNEETKFIGPRGGVSDKGIEDDRLVKGAEVELVIATNNKTLHEVHLPERKKDKEK
jgi:hypothetical protein